MCIGILSSWSISRKLLALLLVVFLPACGIVVWSGLEHRRHALQDAEKNISVVVEAMASLQEQTAGATRQMLVTLAKLPEVRNLDADACNKLFSDLKDTSYSTIFAATLDGTVFAASNPLNPGLNVSDRLYFRRAI
jgi:hypothetical protein